MYRALSVRHRGTNQYRVAIYAKLATLLAAPPFLSTKSDFSGAGQSYAGWAASPTYLSMVAMFDMFFFRFLEPQLATVRVATMASRHKDCSAFTALGQILVTTGTPIEQLFR